MNFSELTIAVLLGHLIKGVTAHYANAPDSALIAAADRISIRIVAALAGGRACFLSSESRSRSNTMDHVRRET